MTTQQLQLTCLTLKKKVKNVIKALKVTTLDRRGKLKQIDFSVMEVICSNLINVRKII